MTITIKEAKEAFEKQFSHLWVDDGINKVGIGDGHIHVGVVSSSEILSQIPDTFMGWPIKKEIIGRIWALKL